ncbi:PEP-CTERM sorting domain-containing protein [Synechocystis salina LEGE 06155]|nr:PEP-CTERM sorting domain-containing protein [Synechocystis salina LEGE 06155]
MSCAVSTELNQDYLNTDPMTVNINPGFFDETNWLFGGKIGVDDGYLGDGSGQSGVFDFSSVNTSEWDKIMLVFKDGAGTYLTGYLLSDGVTSGTWATPFETAANGSIYNFKGKTKDVSHISVYYTASSSTARVSSAVNTAAAPEGGQMAGLVLAIAAAGYFKRKFQ